MSIYELALDFTAKTNRSLFITGKAGTGKTTFLHRLRDTTYKQIAVVAPTGVAAINAGGVTIHSFFQLPFAPFMPTREGEAALISKLKMNTARRNTIRELELLVIDEISMVRADVLDAIDTVLRYVRHRSNEPFGGVQMIFIGDMYQLSPVVKSEEWSLLSQYYQGVYFFNSKVLENNQPVYIEFDKVFRQSDSTFINLLNQIRTDKLTEEGLKLLQTRYSPNFRPSDDDFHITLTTHNYKADTINVEELAKLGSKTKTFRAGIKGQFYESSFPSDEFLELKKGARVMFVKNDTEQPRRFYNGMIGTITLFDDVNETIYVKPDDEDEDVIAVSKMSWENVKYEMDSETMQLKEEVVGTFTQYPLRLAWAITIHKSQGLTFEKAVIDAGDSFAPGQVYVALSRCRTLEGITLLSHINRSSIRNDAQVVSFSSQISDKDTLKVELDKNEQQYKLNLLLDLFNFNSVLYTSKLWHKDIVELGSSFNEEVIPFIRNIVSMIESLVEVSIKFQNQLKAIFSKYPFDKLYFEERMKAASVYYNLQLATIIEVLCDSPANTDSNVNAKIYDDKLNDIFSILSLKQHLVRGISENYSIDNYYKLRNNFVVPKLKISSNAKTTKGKKLKSNHPELLGQLIKLRNTLAEENMVKVFMVVNTNSLIEMSNCLPTNKDSIMRIPGIGPSRYEKYGELFIDIINKYAESNNIEETNIFDTTKKKEKSKQTKGASAKESLRMYKEGMPMDEIAKVRQFVLSTIAGHLASFVKTGEVDILDFVTQDEIDTAKQLISNKAEGDSIYSTLKNNFGSIELNFLNHYFKKSDED